MAHYFRIALAMFLFSVPLTVLFAASLDKVKVANEDQISELKSMDYSVNWKLTKHIHEGMTLSEYKAVKKLYNQLKTSPNKPG